MFGLERPSTESNNNKIKSANFADANNLKNQDPLEVAKQELVEEILDLQEQASDIEKKPTSPKIEKLADNLKKAEERVSTACIRKYGYNPPKEMVLIHAKVEEHYNRMIKNQINISLRYQDIMSKLNELMSIQSKDGKLDLKDEILMKDLIKELNNTNLEMPTTHPGIVSEKSGLKINFSNTDDIDIIIREASRYYNMCESAVHRLFISVQKSFNDLLNIFDISKASLKNDARRKMVDNQIAR